MTKTIPVLYVLDYPVLVRFTATRVGIADGFPAGATEITVEQIVTFKHEDVPFEGLTPDQQNEIRVKCEDSLQ